MGQLAASFKAAVAASFKAAVSYFGGRPSAVSGHNNDLKKLPARCVAVTSSGTGRISAVTGPS